MKEKITKINRRYSAMVVAGVMGVTLLGAGAKVYASPVYTVSLDVNPGIEMGVNMFDRVVSLDANEDAESLLADVNLQNMEVNDAVATAVDAINEAGYFDETGNEIYITATSETDETGADELADELGAAAEEQLAEDGTTVEVTAQGIGYQMVQEAKALSELYGVELTPGKYNLLSRMLESQNAGVEAAVEGEAPVITKEQIGMPVKDIMAQIKAQHTEMKGAATETAVDEETAVEEETAAETETAAVKAQNEVKEQVKAQNTEAKGKANGKAAEKSANANSQKGKAE
jgi:hypothetical protein